MRNVWKTLEMNVDQDKFYKSLNRLLEKYGTLLTLEEVAEVYKYNTTGAVRKAHTRGVLPVDLYKFPNKTGFYAKTVEVAKSIDEMEMSKPVQASQENN